MPRLTQAVLTLSPVPVPVAITAVLALAAPKPAEAQVVEGALEAGSDRNAVYFAQCLLDGDAGTHMTKQEWSRTCYRVARERGDLSSQSAISGAQ